jgi:hypothetical protein
VLVETVAVAEAVVMAQVQVERPEDQEILLLHHLLKAMGEAVVIILLAFKPMVVAEEELVLLVDQQIRDPVAVQEQGVVEVYQALQELI